MAYLASRNQNRIDIWPGFVDALATLLMMIIFLLMVFVVAQFFLGHALSGRDEALERLQGQVAELAELLNLERQANAVLSANTDKLSQKLQASLSAREDLSKSIVDLRMRAGAAEKLARTLKKNLDASLFSIETNKEMINDQLAKIANLSDDIEALKALRA
ncbi:uncharacterized protein METZ01_LOCUS404930, partial [marine metagenome]